MSINVGRLDIEHISCPDSYCRSRCQGCEDDCTLYERFIRMVIEAAEEVFL